MTSRGSRSHRSRWPPCPWPPWDHTQGTGHAVTPLQVEGIPEHTEQPPEHSQCTCPFSRPGWGSSTSDRVTLTRPAPPLHSGRRQLPQAARTPEPHHPRCRRPATSGENVTRTVWCQLSENGLLPLGSHFLKAFIQQGSKSLNNKNVALKRHNLQTAGSEPLGNEAVKRLSQRVLNPACW